MPNSRFLGDALQPIRCAGTNEWATVENTPLDLADDENPKRNQHPLLGPHVICPALYSSMKMASHTFAIT